MPSLPNCRKALSPQHQALLSERKAHEWVAPMVTAVAVATPVTVTGVVELVVVPLPSCPELLSPQHRI